MSSAAPASTILRPAEVPRRRFTRSEYDRLADAGVIRPDERVELVAGEIIQMSPQKPRHAGAIQAATEALRRAFGDGFAIRVQLSLVLDPDSEPEPDIAVVAGSYRDYLEAHPTTALLVVEVADSSLRFDRAAKLPLYARRGIPELWIVNLQDDLVEVHRDPQNDGRYRLSLVLRGGERVAPLGREIEVRVSELLP